MEEFPMFSPLNDPSVDQWFQQFNAPLKRLPAEERAHLHTEVRQHLEALVVANQELGSTPEEAWAHALNQFGKPQIIGKRLAWEWQENQQKPDAAWHAVAFGIRAHLGWVLSFLLLFAILSHTQAGTSKVTLLHNIQFAAAALVLPAFIGVCRPAHALKAALYSLLFFDLIGFCFTLPFFWQAYTGHFAANAQPVTFLSWASGALLGVGRTLIVAYLASVTRRGWYKPTLADFKLRLPRRRAVSQG